MSRGQAPGAVRNERAAGAIDRSIRADWNGNRRPSSSVKVTYALGTTDAPPGGTTSHHRPHRSHSRASAHALRITYPCWSGSLGPMPLDRGHRGFAADFGFIDQSILGQRQRNRNALSGEPSKPRCARGRGG